MPRKVLDKLLVKKSFQDIFRSDIMKKDYPNPGETYKNHAPVIVSASDATGIAPNMPPDEGKQMATNKDLGDAAP